MVFFADRQAVNSGDRQAGIPALPGAKTLLNIE